MAEPADLREALEAIQSAHDKALGEEIDQRDAAEEALSQAFYLVTGRSPEWSNKFSHQDALDEIGECVALLKDATKAALASPPAKDAAPTSAVNLPFDRLPECACDEGVGRPPTQQQKLECRLRGSPCREGWRGGDTAAPTSGEGGLREALERLQTGLRSGDDLVGGAGRSGGSFRADDIRLVLVEAGHWERLRAMAETGTAANFLLCDDDVKRDFFAMAVSDSTRRKQAEEALALLTKPAPDIAADGWRDIVWMLETPATDNSPTRWWNPDTGWMIDPAKGIRFCRQEDAEAFKRSARSMLPCRATEHVFLNIPQPDGADRP